MDGWLVMMILMCPSTAGLLGEKENSNWSVYKVDPRVVASGGEHLSSNFSKERERESGCHPEQGGERKPYVRCALLGLNTCVCGLNNEWCLLHAFFCKHIIVLYRPSGIYNSNQSNIQSANGFRFNYAYITSSRDIQR